MGEAPGAGLDYLAHLAADSARFVEAVSEAPSNARVPSCPDWDADDLLWHLSGVQWFWGQIVTTRAESPDAVEAVRPARPADRAGLVEFAARASGALLDALAADPDTEVWTWFTDHSVRWVRRRQAHEALIHRVDAELTAGSRTAMDPALSADGVDEALQVMFGGLPTWGVFTPNGHGSLRVRASDTGHAWAVVVGGFTGENPTSGKRYVDEPVLEVVQDDGRSVVAEITGSAADLDCALWNRPPLGTLDRTGDLGLLAAFDRVVDDGIQ